MLDHCCVHPTWYYTLFWYTFVGTVHCPRSFFRCHSNYSVPPRVRGNGHPGAKETKVFWVLISVIPCDSHTLYWQNPGNTIWKIGAISTASHWFFDVFLVFFYSRLQKEMHALVCMAGNFSIHRLMFGGHCLRNQGKGRLYKLQLDAGAHKPVLFDAADVIFAKK